MKHALASLAIGACLLLPSAGVVLGAGPPAKPAQSPTTGQPGTSNGVNCGGAGSGGLPTPGHSASSPGAPFNEPAPVGIGSGGVAGAVYAGSGPSLGAANSMAAVSQYDIACANQPP